MDKNTDELLTQPRRSDVIERWRHVYEKRSLAARLRAWLALMGHAYQRPGAPWYALLGAAILLVLVMYIAVVREMVK